MVPVGLLIIHDTYYDERSNRTRNYHRVPDSTCTKYIQGVWVEINQELKETIQITSVKNARRQQQGDKRKSNPEEEVGLFEEGNQKTDDTCIDL